MNEVEDKVKDFNRELLALYECRPPISKEKMGSITKSAIKSIKFYKHVVLRVEKFVRKCDPEFKVPGLYVIDSIVRQSQHQFGKDKDVFATRFTKNINRTFKNLFKCPLNDRGKIVRVLNLWQKNNVFHPDVVQPLLDMANPNHPVHQQTVEASPPVVEKTPGTPAKRADINETAAWALGQQPPPQPSTEEAILNLRSQIIPPAQKLLDFDYVDDEDDDKRDDNSNNQNALAMSMAQNLQGNPDLANKLQQMINTIQQTEALKTELTAAQEVQLNKQRSRQQEEELQQQIQQHHHQQQQQMYPPQVDDQQMTFAQPPLIGVPPIMANNIPLPMSGMQPHNMMGMAIMPDGGFHHDQMMREGKMSPKKEAKRMRSRSMESGESSKQFREDIAWKKEMEKEMKELKEENGGLRKRVTSLEGSVTSLEDGREKDQKKIKTLQKQVDDINVYEFFRMSQMRIIKYLFEGRKVFENVEIKKLFSGEYAMLSKVSEDDKAKFENFRISLRAKTKIDIITIFKGFIDSRHYDDRITAAHPYGDHRILGRRDSDRITPFMILREEQEARVKKFISRS